MKGIFESNATRLRELQVAVTAAHRRRKEGAEELEIWKEAARSFTSAFDTLAFPGGLEKAMAALKARDPGTLEMAVRFLEADPWFCGKRS